MCRNVLAHAEAYSVLEASEGKLVSGRLVDNDRQFGSVPIGSPMTRNKSLYPYPRSASIQSTCRPVNDKVAYYLLQPIQLRHHRRTESDWTRRLQLHHFGKLRDLIHRQPPILYGRTTVHMQRQLLMQMQDYVRCCSSDAVILLDRILALDNAVDWP